MPNGSDLVNHDLLADMIRKTRRFKISVAVFVAFVVSGIIALLIITAVTLSQVKAKQDALTAAISSLEGATGTLNSTVTQLKTNTDSQLTKQGKQFDCFGSFLARTDRQDLVVKDLDNCLIEAANGSQISPAGVQTGGSQPAMGANSTNSGNGNGGGTSQNNNQGNGSSGSQQNGIIQKTKDFFGNVVDGAKKVIKAL